MLGWRPYMDVPQSNHHKGYGKFKKQTPKEGIHTINTQRKVSLVSMWVVCTILTKMYDCSVHFLKTHSKTYKKKGVASKSKSIVPFQTTFKLIAEYSSIANF